MLGKLIRHEWKSTYKMGCLVLCAMVAITFFGWLAFQAPMWQSLGGRSSSSFGWPDIFSIVTLMLYVMLLVCANFGILIYLGVHFYRTMYTDEGYLTHTLPVTKNQILVSKIFVSGMWMLFMLLAVYLSLFLLCMSMVSLFMPEDLSFGILWGKFSAELWEMLRDLNWRFDFDVIQWLAMMIITSLLGPFMAMTILFGAISIGQLVPKHRLLMGILCYIVLQVIGNLLTALFRSFSGSIGGYMNASVNAGFVVNLLMAVALYAVSYYVTSRKLNLV